MNDLFEGPALSEDPEGSSTLSRAERRALREERRLAAKRRQRALVAVLVAVIVIGAGGYFVWTRGVEYFGSVDVFSSEPDAPTDFTGPGTGETQITVSPGDVGTVIGDKLVEAGVVASRQAFVAAYTANPDAAGIQAGTYNLFKEMKASDALTSLLDIENRVDYYFDIQPGFTAAQAIARIAKHTGLTEEEINAAIADTAAAGLPAEAGGSYEGWLSPGVYQFGLETTPLEMVTEMVARTVATLDTLGVAPENRQVVLTKASIVERESASAVDEARPLVASVIENRLEIGQKLQMDSTVHYIFGGTEDATTSAEQRQSDNPYNTYYHKGLPPTAIASPSEQSIQAVLTAPETDYFYFVTVNPSTGETLFAETYPEQQQNELLYHEWLKSQ